ncbi:MAG: metallophosphoesterase family protein [Candidatus Bathyarchaeia archaeon]
MLAFTDFHGSRGAVERAVQASEEVDPDLILVAGDLAFGSGESSKEALRDLGGVCGMLFFVPGNMDPRELAEFSSGNVYPLHGRCLSHGGVDFLGLGGAPKGPFGTPFEYDEKYADTLLRRGLEGCRGGVLVVVSHSPPYGGRLDLTARGVHAGCKALRRFMEEAKPSLVVCGHIHEARGMEELSGTMVVNPGPAYAGYYAHIKVDGEMRVELVTP